MTKLRDQLTTWRNEPVRALVEQLKKEQAQLAGHRFDLALGKLKAPSTIRRDRKTIARLATLISEKIRASVGKEQG